MVAVKTGLPRRKFDVVIVGSGAAGGTLASRPKLTSAASHAAGYRRRKRLRRKCIGLAAAAELAITTPEITKNTWTPIHPKGMTDTRAGLCQVR